MATSKRKEKRLRKKRNRRVKMLAMVDAKWAAKVKELRRQQAQFIKQGKS